MFFLKNKNLGKTQWTKDLQAEKKKDCILDGGFHFFLIQARSIEARKYVSIKKMREVTREKTI